MIRGVWLAGAVAGDHPDADEVVAVRVERGALTIVNYDLAHCDVGRAELASC
jgi:hypothetical protein